MISRFALFCFVLTAIACAPVSVPNVPSAIDTQGSSPNQSCLFTHDTQNDFRIQCQAFISFYVGFRDQSTGKMLDLNKQTFDFEILDAEGNTVDKSSPFGNSFRQDSSLVEDTQWLRVNEFSTTAPFTMTASVAGYQAITTTIVKSKREDSANYAFNEIVIDLIPN